MLIFGVALIALIVFTTLAILGFFSMRPSEKIMAHHHGADESKDILVKKYYEADVNKFRSTFLLVGLCITLGSLILGFNYIPSSDSEEVKLVAQVDEEEVENIPQTNQTKPPPPPPPPPPEVIEVEDEEILEEEPEIFMQEFDDDVEIAEPVFVEAVVEEEEVVEPEIFLVVEDMPAYPGGDQAMYGFLYKNISYPQVAKENGIEGKVYVRFVVDESGKVIQSQVVRGIGGGCDEEALKAVKAMPRWTPGKQRGKPVRVQFTIPIHFTLE